MKYAEFSQTQRGFSLIELAIVFIIIGILLGSFIGTFTERIENSRVSDTVDELEEIKTAMTAYAFVNGFLPCPDCDAAAGACLAADVGDGVADYNVTECKENEGVGNVPWVTLGIGRADSWSTRYRYSVQNEYADSAIPFTLTTAAGSAIIQEPDFVADNTGATPKNLATSVVAILFSHGKNSFGGISDGGVARGAIPAANIDELENTDNDQFYYTRPQTTAAAAIAGSEFDDIVRWISEYELKAKMVEAGALP